MVERWKMSPNQSMVTEPDGGYVEYDDHIAAIEEMYAESSENNREWVLICEEKNREITKWRDLCLRQGMEIHRLKAD